MAFPTLSQTISKPKVQTLINAKGDTLIQMSLADAKIILSDILSKQVGDSILKVYMHRDTLNKSTIILQLAEIRLIQKKLYNQEQITSNLNRIIANKDKEIVDLNSVIKKQKKEIRKQKFLKIVGFTAAVVIPITIILYTTK